MLSHNYGLCGVGVSDELYGRGDIMILGFMRSLKEPEQTPLRFPTHSFEYSSHAYRGRQLRPKYRALGRMISRRKHREYVLAKYDQAQMRSPEPGIAHDDGDGA